MYKIGGVDGAREIDKEGCTERFLSLIPLDSVTLNATLDML